MKRVRQFVSDLVMLGAVTILMRSISVVFNAYVSGKIGAEGMGLYSLITGMYGFAVTLATSGVHLAVTRLVSEELGKNNKDGAIRAVKKCFVYALVFGTLAFALLFFGADLIGNHFLHDKRACKSLRILAFALPFISLSNVFSGYFGAVRRVYKNASANLIEQLVKIALIVVLISKMAERGIEYAVMALVIGSAASEALSFLYLLIFYRFDKKRHIGKTSSQNDSTMTKRMLEISLPVAFSSYLRSGLITLEHSLIPLGLKKFGMNESAALASYGTIGGMVFPLILFPSAICSAVAGLIVPELSELAETYGKVKGQKHICYIVRRVLVFALFFGIGTAGVLLSFSRPLGLFVYESEEAAKFIRLFAPLVPIMYLDTTVDGMLKGLGQQMYSMAYNIIDAALSVVLVSLLVPRIGIYGYVICIFITELVNLAFSLSRLLVVTGASLPLIKAVVFPLLCISGATAGAMLFLGKRAQGEMPLTLLVCGIFVCVLFYILLLRTTNAFDKEDARWMRRIFRPLP